MNTKEKIIQEVHLKGEKENLDRFASSIPDYLQTEWAFSDDNYSNRYYIGEKFPPFRVCLVILNDNYILRYIIPTDEDAPDKFEEAQATKCMKYFLEQFAQYASDCNVDYEITYEESDGE